MAQSSTLALEAGQQRVVRPSEDLGPNTVCTTSTIAIPCAHDGTVSTYSQQLDKSKGTNVIWANATITGVNHMEEFNHYKTKEAFRLALETTTYGTTFKK